MNCPDQIAPASCWSPPRVRPSSVAVTQSTAMLSHSLETRRLVGTCRNSKKSFLAIWIQNDSEWFRDIQKATGFHCVFIVFTKDAHGRGQSKWLGRVVVAGAQWVQGHQSCRICNGKTHAFSFKQLQTAAVIDFATPLDTFGSPKDDHRVRLVTSLRPCP